MSFVDDAIAQLRAERGVQHVPFDDETGLHGAVGYNGYCGPTAMAALTGLQTHEAAREIRKITKQRYIKGVRTADLIAALRAVGLRPLKIIVDPKRFTLQAWLKQRAPDGTYLVEVTDHFVVAAVRRGEPWVMDNKAYAGVATHPMRLRKVHAAYYVRP